MLGMPRSKKESGLRTRHQIGRMDSARVMLIATPLRRATHGDQSLCDFLPSAASFSYKLKDLCSSVEVGRLTISPLSAFYRFSKA